MGESRYSYQFAFLTNILGEERSCGTVVSGLTPGNHVRIELNTPMGHLV